ncbi:hypothetical protein ACLQ24_22615 [Micromonospora sp. DT4]|uniref:hypothetical protein n=1 Tax=Micromonospora sp. DT4 TaxID=3393438 RepID=UPI003CF0A244
MDRSPPIQQIGWDGRRFVDAADRPVTGVPTPGVPRHTARHRVRGQAPARPGGRLGILPHYIDAPRTP